MFCSAILLYCAFLMTALLLLLHTNSPPGINKVYICLVTVKKTGRKHTCSKESQNKQDPCTTKMPCHGGVIMVGVGNRQYTTGTYWTETLHRLRCFLSVKIHFSKQLTTAYRLFSHGS